MLTWILVKQERRHSSGAGYGAITCFCEHDNEPAGCESLQSYGILHHVTSVDISKESSAFETSGTDYPKTRRHITEEGRSENSVS
jgi:hypothetical protein